MALKNATAGDFNVAASYNGRYSDYPLGNKPSTGYGSTNAIYNALYDAFFGAFTFAGTKYCRTTGSDTTGNGTTGNPYQTIGKLISMMAANERGMIGPGTYDGPGNWISSTQRTIPSGTDAAHPTLIQAENPFETRIRMTSAPSGYGDGPLNLANTVADVLIDGIIFESTVTNLPVSDSNINAVTANRGVRCTVSRYIGKSWSADTHGSIIEGGTADDYGLYQDGAVMGSYRYAVRSGGDGSNTPAGKFIVRRCVIFAPFGMARQPSAAVAHYGTDDPNYAGRADVAWQNVLVIGSPNLPFVAENKYADFLTPKSTRNMLWRGCITVGGGAEFGAFSSDNGFANNTWTATDCVVANFSNGSPASVYAFRKPTGSGTCTITRYTIVGHPGANFLPPDGVTASLGLTAAVVYPVVPQSGNGASVLKAWGAFGKRWGETGYDTQQTTPLWPWPYEDIYKTEFGNAITRPTNDVPTSPTSSVSPLLGTALDGNPKTITRLVFEAGGTPMPPDLAPYLV